MNNYSWDDIKFVLAVARAGSLNAAAKMLGVTHATVMRRVASFEDRHGQAIFLKSASGYSVLPEAEKILRAAGNVEDAIYSVERAVHGSDQTLSGTVQIASTDSLCQTVLPGIVQFISQKYPELSLSLLSANTHHDLSRLSADIAIRPTLKLDAGLTGDIVGELEFQLYSSTPDCTEWIGMKGALKRSKAAQWMSSNVPEHRIVHQADSFLVMRELAARGLGKVFLPSFLGDSDPRLEQIGHGLPRLSVPVWVATQEDIARNVRFSVVRQELCRELACVFRRSSSAKTTPNHQNKSKSVEKQQ